MTNMQIVIMRRNKGFKKDKSNKCKLNEIYLRLKTAR